MKNVNVKKIFHLIATLFVANECLKLISLVPVLVGILLSQGSTNAITPILSMGGQVLIHLLIVGLIMAISYSKNDYELESQERLVFLGVGLLLLGLIDLPQELFSMYTYLRLARMESSGGYEIFRTYTYMSLSGLVREGGMIAFGLVVLARSRGKESVVRDYDSV